MCHDTYRIAIMCDDLIDGIASGDITPDTVCGLSQERVRVYLGIKRCSPADASLVCASVRESIAAFLGKNPDDLID